ncbi:MAG: hypothetical protein EGMGGAKC_00710 [Dehalococcoides mccartyi]|nr:hypothetical protein [Dehalococcoides mccartyi]
MPCSSFIVPTNTCPQKTLPSLRIYCFSRSKWSIAPVFRSFTRLRSYAKNLAGVISLNVIEVNSSSEYPIILHMVLLTWVNLKFKSVIAMPTGTWSNTRWKRSSLIWSCFSTFLRSVMSSESIKIPSGTGSILSSNQPSVLSGKINRFSILSAVLVSMQRRSVVNNSVFSIPGYTSIRVWFARTSRGWRFCRMAELLRYI